MLDPKLLRSDIDGIARNLARRGVALDREMYLELESGRKAAQVEVEEFRKIRNERSKAIGKAKAAGDDIEPLRAEVGETPPPQPERLDFRRCRNCGQRVSRLATCGPDWQLGRQSHSCCGLFFVDALVRWAL